MNAKTLALRERHLSTAARKVLSAVPIQEVWSDIKVRTELRRQGIGIDPSVVGGCLQSLTESGLIRRLRSGYQRTSVPVPPEDTTEDQGIDCAEPVAAAVAPEPSPAPTPAPAPVAKPAPSPEPCLATRMSDLASELGGITQMLDRIKRAAAELDEIAVAVLEREQAHAKEVAKLHQLRELLGSI